MIPLASFFVRCKGFCSTFFIFKLNSDHLLIDDQQNRTVSNHKIVSSQTFFYILL